MKNKKYTTGLVDNSAMTPNNIVHCSLFIVHFSLLFSLFPIFAQEGPTVDRERGQVNSEPLWRQALGGEITGPPSVQVQSVVMTLDGGNIRAYSSGGRPLWNYSARGRLSPYVTRSREGTSYISRNNGIFIAVNRAGRELWRRNTGAALSGQVVCGWDGRLFVPLGKKIICYTAAGRQLWSRDFTTAIRVSPGLDQSGGIILTLENNELLRIDPFGAVQSRELPRQARSIVSLEGGTYMVLYESGGAELLNFSSADARAAPALPQPPLAAASRGSLAAVCLADGSTALISGTDNRIIWTGESHMSVIRKNGGRADTQAAVLFDERGIYVLSPSGATGFAEDGRRLWFTMLENAATIPAFGDDGILYSGGRDWILYAYRLEERSRQQTQTLYGPAPPGNYGLGAPPPSLSADDPYRHEGETLRARLAVISSAIQAGNLGGNEIEWTAYLMETASGEYGQALPTAPLQYRVQALRLLAQLGSRETLPFLTEIFTRDREAVVRAAAAEAIGAIGVDPDGLALRAFASAVSSAAQSRDEQVLMAVASATGALCRFSGPPLSDTGIRILNLINSSGQPKLAQQRAQRELMSLK